MLNTEEKLRCEGLGTVTHSLGDTADFREGTFMRGYPHVGGYNMQASEKLR